MQLHIWKYAEIKYKTHQIKGIIKTQEYFSTPKARNSKKQLKTDFGKQLVILLLESICLSTIQNVLTNTIIGYIDFSNRRTLVNDKNFFSRATWDATEIERHTKNKRGHQYAKQRNVQPNRVSKRSTFNSELPSYKE